MGFNKFLYEENATRTNNAFCHYMSFIWTLILACWLYTVIWWIFLNPLAKPLLIAHNFFVPYRNHCYYDWTARIEEIRFCLNTKDIVRLKSEKWSCGTMHVFVTHILRGKPQLSSEQKFAAIPNITNHKLRWYLIRLGKRCVFVYNWGGNCSQISNEFMLINGIILCILYDFWFLRSKELVKQYNYAIGKFIPMHKHMCLSKAKYSILVNIRLSNLLQLSQVLLQAFSGAQQVTFNRYF